MSPHRALHNHEIVFMIFEQFASHKGHYMLSQEKKPDRVALARAARVCKAFSDAALDVLWRRLDSIVPLLALFSSFIRVPMDDNKVVDEHDERNHIYTICGETSNDDWTRFGSYAKRVRAVSCDPCRVEQSLFFYLSHRNFGRPLLPLVREIEWHAVDIIMDASVLTLVAPSLRRLTINFSRDKNTTGTRRNCLLKTLLTEISSIASNVEELKITHFDDLRSITPVLGFAQLRKLSILHSLSTEEFSFEALAMLQNLEDLSISIPERATFTHCSGFTTLRRLKLTGTFSDFTNCFLNISPPSLQTLQLSLDSLIWPTAENCRICLAAAYSAFKSSLLEFSLILCHRFTILPRRAPSITSIIEFIEPTLSIPGMKKLECSCLPLNMSLSNRMLQHIATSCPKLESLRFVCFASWFNGDHLDDVPSLDGLRTLFRLAPDLTDLEIPYLWTDPLPNMSDQLVISSKLRHLSLAPVFVSPGSRLDKDISISFLERSFPNLATSDRPYTEIFNLND
ncbi:uncharacterized protein LAESUDRAFT_748894 [Laetiporus sulphureus 93-53]|uniref:F-box domain-containing protein n=1 Tax=Laetiporus sulphureus 93-53 TaxID=1314785 RepID=A0A165F4M6_9APHY|nr:uncharacterized protein LAESUDRAFT_748894 [Laetiporus sulphureus 93-53]KZT08376.1 hypothetical protein LAESUDRAFT_748894 [Laetiporus sulphureus 93-53]